MTAKIRCKRDVEHEARCVEAIRQRRMNEAAFRVVDPRETARVKASVFFKPSAIPVGKPGLNPWGRKGRPEIAA